MFLNASSSVSTQLLEEKSTLRIVCQGTRIVPLKLLLPIKYKAFSEVSSHFVLCVSTGRIFEAKVSKSTVILLDSLCMFICVHSIYPEVRHEH